MQLHLDIGKTWGGGGKGPGVPASSRFSSWAFSSRSCFPLVLVVNLDVMESPFTKSRFSWGCIILRLCSCHIVMLKKKTIVFKVQFFVTVLHTLHFILLERKCGVLQSIASFFALIHVSYLCVFYVNNTLIRSSTENSEAVDALIIIIVENPRSSCFPHFYSCLIHALKFFF